MIMTRKELWEMIEFIETTLHCSPKEHTFNLSVTYSGVFINGYNQSDETEMEVQAS